MQRSSSGTRKWPSDGKHRTNQALGSSTPSRRGGTSPLGRARPSVITEIRSYSAHKGIAGNEKADEWAKIAAEELHTRGVELRDRSDREVARAMHLPRSLANFKRDDLREELGGRPDFQKDVPLFKEPEAR